MNAPAVEGEQRLLSCFDAVLDAPASQRHELIRARFGSDGHLVRELEQLLAAAERDAGLLTESVDALLQPVLADLAGHLVTQAELPEVLSAALSPRYAVLERIGRGGMATVYLAFDNALGRHVAIKWLRPELADALSRDRFEQEIAIAATVDHPHIVPVYDRGEVNGLLYYVMRYVEGGSLRDLLAEQPQLEIRRAIAIARNVAGALDTAHAKKIVHRDIKPANILLDERGAHVADFGVARLIDAAGREHLTRTGIAVGTALYMSPEQAGSASKVDARSDVYSLACVLYEMLAGEAPFTGPTQRDIMAKHLAAAIPDLTVVRATVTSPMQQVMASALAKSPADRFATSGEFIDAFERAYTSSGDALPPPRPRIRRIRLRTAAIATLGSLLLGLGTWRMSSGMRATTLDADLHVVFPFDVSGDAPLDAAQRLREALARWAGVRVVDQFTLEGKLGASLAGGLSDRRVRSTVRSLGAGRFIRGRVEPDGETWRVVATLFDVDSGQLVEVPGRVGKDLGDADSAIAVVAERLLFHNLLGAGDAVPSTGTTNFAARRAYLAGQDAIREWDLASADSAFFRATELDADYSQAQLWLAQVRFWRAQPSSRWRDFVARAIAGQLSTREQTVALALQQWASDEVVESCATWERLATAEQHDAFFWYSAHRCRFRDELVVPDPASPTKWRFRSSHHLAIEHMERALALRPVIYRGLRANGFEQLRLVLKTRAGLLRRGYSAEGMAFAAYPMVLDDTLAFIPSLQSEFMLAADVRHRYRQEISAALQRQRQLFREWTITWASNDPQNAEAWEAVAVALETLGDASALDTIARARQLARSRADQRRISGTQAWLLVKFSLPSNREGIRRARILADSVLRSSEPPSDDRQLLVSLAALTGRLSLAKEYARFLPDWPRLDAPAGVNEAGANLLLHAALGGPAGELGELEQRADSLIKLAVAEPERGAVRRDVLGRAASLAFPLVMSALSDSPATSALIAQQLWLRGDRKGSIAILSGVRISRSSIPPANLQFDALLPEARLVEMAEGIKEAAEWLDPTLASIREGSYQNLLEPVRAASLVGAMALRADLANRSGDRVTAARWAAVVGELWTDCEPPLCLVRDRMRALTR